MHSDILACERSAYPLLLHCLQDLEHDWSHLRLVNKNMCAAFMHYKIKVALHTAKRQRNLRNVDEKRELWAQFERTLSPDFPLVRGLEQRNEPRTVSYSNNIFDKSFDSPFLRGFRIFNAAPLATGAAVQTEVVEVD